jgi:hypothetical protein
LEEKNLRQEEEKKKRKEGRKEEKGNKSVYAGTRGRLNGKLQPAKPGCARREQFLKSGVGLLAFSFP